MSAPRRRVDRGRKPRAHPTTERGLVKAPVREYWSPCDTIKLDASDLSEETTRELVRSIRQYGFVTPCIFWPSRNSWITSGARIIAAKLLWTEDPNFLVPHTSGRFVVPVRLQEFASEADAKAYALIDHELIVHPVWDDALVEDVQTKIIALDDKHTIT